MSIDKNIAAKFGFISYESIFDEVPKEAGESDSQYLDRLAVIEYERRDPEKAKIKRELGVKFMERKAAEQREADKKRREELISSMSLDAFEEEHISEKAAELANMDVANGKIGVSGMSKAIREYTDKLTADKKAEKASNIQMNEMIRGTRGTDREQ